MNEEIRNIRREKYLRHQASQNFTGDVKSIIIIQRFIKKYYFSPCINQDEIPNIPIKYRIRISFGLKHYYENPDLDILRSLASYHRLGDVNSTIFRYCFDIRKVSDQKKVEINGKVLFFQSEDLLRIKKLATKQ